MKVMKTCQGLNPGNLDAKWMKKENEEVKRITQKNEEEVKRITRENEEKVKIIIEENEDEFIRNKLIGKQILVNYVMFLKGRRK